MNAGWLGVCALGALGLAGCGNGGDSGLVGLGGSASVSGGGSAGSGMSGGAGEGGSGGTSMPRDAGSDAMALGGSSSGGGGSGFVLPADCPVPSPEPVPGQTIAIQSVRFNTAEIVLKNVSDTEQTILGGRRGWQWCNYPAYWSIILEEEDVVLSPGETYAFVAINNTGGLLQMDEEGGELGIYTTTGAFTTVEYMKAFASWGTGLAAGAAGREPTAVEGGYWTFYDRIEIEEGHRGFVAVGRTDVAEGYQSVPARCLRTPPNER